MKARLLFILFSISIMTILSLALSVVSNAQTGDALSFDGNDRVIVPNSPSLNPTQITVEAWVKPNRQTDPSDWGTSQFLITKGSDDTLGTYYLAQGYDRKFRFKIGPQWQNPATTSLSGPSTEIQLNRWYHVAGTYDGNIMRLYVDGVLEDTKVVGPLQFGNSSPLFFSYNDYPGWNYFFNGQMRDVRIWNYARTENEILQNMSGQLSGTESGLAGYWRLDEASGQIANDSSSNGNNGQLGSTSGIDSDDPTWVTSSSGGSNTCITTLNVPTDTTWTGAVNTYQGWDWCSICLPEATWIWKSFLAETNSYADFTKTINIEGQPISGNILLLADNLVDIYVNGHYAGTIEDNWVGPALSVDISSLLSTGSNTILLHAYNKLCPGCETPYNNPAGVSGSVNVSYMPSSSKPSLSLSNSTPFWATYAEYQARELSLTMTITKNTPETAYDVAITGSTNTNGVTLLTATPIAIKDVFDSNSENTTVRYHVPVGVGSFKLSITASASDACGTSYFYP